MLRSVREAAGLGSLPEPFSTNASESVNALLKVKLDDKRSELPLFVKKMEELAQEQLQKFENAIIDRGKFRVKEKYRSLVVPEGKWFRMSKDARTIRIEFLPIGP